MGENAQVRRCAVGIVFMLSAVNILSCERPDSSNEYKPVLDAYLRAWNGGSLDSLDRVADQHFVLRMSPEFLPVTGLDSLKNAIVSFRSSYPDMHITLNEEIYARNAVAARWTITASRAMAAEGNAIVRPVSVQGMSIIHVGSGKVLDEWISGNDLEWLRQLGYTVAPPLPDTAARELQQ